MKKPKLKTSLIENTVYVDTNTGEITGSNTKKHTYVANTKEEFILLYVNALPPFMNLSNPAKTVYAYILNNYTFKSQFEIGGATRGLMSKQLGFASSTIANALTELVIAEFLYSISKGLYQINPIYAFKGSGYERNETIKAIIELKCKEKF